MVDFNEIAARVPLVSEEQLAAYEAARVEHEAEDARRKASADRRERAHRIAGMPIARAMVNAILDDTLEPTLALVAVRDWVKAPRAERCPTLVLLGGPGCGKTTAAAWAIARTRGTYVKMRDAANLYRAGFGDDAERWTRMLGVSCLVVDELSTERDVDLGRAALHEIIDERQAHDRMTLLLANQTKRQIADRYDARTIDRLREGSLSLELDGASMRKGAAW